jgi:hypothetical protein
LNAITQQKELHAELPFWQHGLAFLVTCAVLISRRPDAVLHAQFFQEDGHTWYADVYNFGWWAGVCRIYEGYHHVFMRLGAALSLLVPLALAPLVLNCIAIVLQALPVNLLLSNRSSAWGSLRFRAVAAGIYLALPNTREMLNNISQSQWPLTLCAFLLLVASPPKGVAARLFDISILLLCGLTGPQCIFLLPIAIFIARRNRDYWRYAGPGVLAATCFVQAWGLLNGGFSSRSHFTLGAGPTMLARILGGQVYLGTILGGNGLATKSSAGVLIFLLCAAAGGTVVVAFCFAESVMQMRLFLLLTLALLAASLVSPTAYPPVGVTVWELLARANGIRYWYFPSLAFAWLLLYGSQSRPFALKTVSAVLLCAMCFGIIRDWRVPPFPDLHFAEDAKRFEAAPAGTEVIFKQNPEGWNMTLVKHAPAQNGFQ